ncbi:hypothetical protein GPX89_32575 [Nocardia sp. ET3-3]|uniref:Low molecular weight antigen MTB12-like C-terminal domain-containing protein n=1 Tax=Nocardia terrae TaxID=2675851 RepID=A0A7K1V668_9NOCA|nr:hypothetical protein [Nocardia terrae]MVU81961.1 hypothetical protein [Nocardia terrae]
MSNRIPVLESLALCALTAAVLAACGVSAKEPTTTHVSATTAGGSDTALTQAVTDVYQKFFDGSTSADQKIAVLENGQAFADTIRGQADSPLAKGTKADVSSVKPADADHADVVFTVSLNGTPALVDQQGSAVRVTGAWKVAAATFCALLSLETQGKPPAPCAAGSVTPTS